MKKKKRYVVVLVVLAIYLLLMFFVFGKDGIRKSKQDTTIIVGQDTIWNYSKGSWSNITNSAKSNDISWQEYKVYLDNKYAGDYYLWYNDKWYMFDKNKNAITKEGNLLAFRSNYDIKVKDFTTKEITDYTYVAKVLQENNINPSTTQYTVNDQILIDIDDDGQQENLYIISNVFALDFYPETIFSIVFMEKDGKTYTIYEDVSKNTSTNGCKPYLNTILDIDDDNTYELVLSCGRYSITEPIDMLYKLTDEEFKILISNQ